MSRVGELLVPARLGRDFRWLLGSSWTYNLGDGITLAAGPLLVASQTDSAFLVALASLLQRLPWLLFGLYSGVLVDRLNRRAIIVSTSAIRLAVLAVLIATIATDTVNIGLVLAVLFVLGVNETLADTTDTTLLPMLVDKADLGVANARNFAGFSLANQLVGPPIGAALFAAGRAWPFAAELICVLAAMTLFLRVRLPHHAPDRDRTRVRDDIRAGWRWLWHHDAIRTLAITIFTFNVTFGAAWSVLVLYARDRLGLGAIGYGLITTVSAVGGLTGTLAYGWLERHFSLGHIMRVGLLIETFTHLALALITWAWLAMIVFFVFGAHAFVWGTTSTSVRQRAVPTEFQGRVSSVYLTGVFGGLVVGAAIGGVLAQAFGITAPFWFAFVGSALLVTWIWKALLQIGHADAAIVAAG